MSATTGGLRVSESSSESIAPTSRELAQKVCAHARRRMAARAIQKQKPRMSKTPSVSRCCWTSLGSGAARDCRGAAKTAAVIHGRTPLSVDAVGPVAVLLPTPLSRSMLVPSRPASVPLLRRHSSTTAEYAPRDGPRRRAARASASAGGMVRPNGSWKRNGTSMPDRRKNSAGEQLATYCRVSPWHSRCG